MLCIAAQSCPTLCDPMDCSPPGSSAHGASPGKNTGVGCHDCLQGIFPTWSTNPGLTHCRWILDRLSHQESLRILEWAAYPFSRGSSQPRNQSRVSCISGEFSTSWATREAPMIALNLSIPALMHTLSFLLSKILSPIILKKFSMVTMNQYQRSFSLSSF